MPNAASIYLSTRGRSSGTKICIGGRPEAARVVTDAQSIVILLRQIAMLSSFPSRLFWARETAAACAEINLGKLGPSFCLVACRDFASFNLVNYLSFLSLRHSTLGQTVRLVRVALPDARNTPHYRGNEAGYLFAFFEFPQFEIYLVLVNSDIQFL